MASPTRFPASSDTSVADIFASVHNSPRDPDIKDLSARLRFQPTEGRIWLDDRRMALIHFTAFAALRRELVASLGVDVARGLLTRMGYASGSEDAELARRIRGDRSSADAFVVGPQLHMLEGIVRVEPVRVELDPTKGHDYGEFIWLDSAEADCQPSAFGFAPEASAGFSDDLVGASSAFNAACHLLGKVAKTRATVLFLGETGVGKEMFARTLHRVSDRAAAPFVAINCAAIPETLIEAELFGVERGAFTGATSSRPGRFEIADGGTLFLDEVGTLSLGAQAKLLRVLQCGEIERVGEVKTRKVNVRIVTATNEELHEKVRAGQFRADLYYRLKVFPIRVPPLRDRRDDVPILIRYFLTKFCSLYAKKILGFTDRAIGALLDYAYPGNVRELEHMVERAVILAADGGAIDVAMLFDASPGSLSAMGVDDQGLLQPVAADESLGAPESRTTALAEQALREGVALNALSDAIMKRALEDCGGNLSKAARAIGLTRPQLAYRLGKQE